MTPVINIVQTTTLWFREGSSDNARGRAAPFPKPPEGPTPAWSRRDNVYQASIGEQGGGHVVTFAYGRRGSTLNTGTKTPQPVSLAEAARIYDKLVASKLAKGYTPGEGGTPYAATGNEGRDTGVRCQLANAIEAGQAEACVASHLWCAQEKFDGRRILVRKGSGGITGINRRGLAVALPGPVAGTAAKLPGTFLIDGEAVGDTVHAFDILEKDGRDLRKLPLSERLVMLEDLLAGLKPPSLRLVPTVIHPWEKEDLVDGVKQRGGEGIVFKRLDAPWSAGRPASGGDWLKFKFVETASFVAGEPNRAKRSVALWLLDEAGHRVPAGNVTIPPNHKVPAPGSVVEVKYLNASEQSGSVYQPVYLGPRDDIPADECVTSQLKPKPQPGNA